MPNWCYQNLEVRGPSPDIDEFLDAMQQSVADPNGEMHTVNQLNHLCPLDERTYAYKTITDKDGNATLIKTYATLEENGFDGYEHACSVWGTKWGACDIEVNSERGKYPLHIRFESAWSPASGLIKGISAKYPTLIFGLRYTEEADFFAGYEIIQNGKIYYSADIGSIDSKEAEEWLATQEQLAKSNPEIKEQDYMDTFYEMCDEARLVRDDKLELQYQQQMNSYAKYYSAKPPKAKVITAPF